METVRLAAAVLLPWLAGFALVRASMRRVGTSNAWVEVGYGHFAGLALLVIGLRVADAAGIGLAFGPVAAFLAIVAAATLALGPRRATAAAVSDPPAAAPKLMRWLAAIALVLIALRVATMSIDVAMRPLFAWDSWSQWGTKAKVWSELRTMAPFVDFNAWLARPPGAYTDTAPHYPGTIPLLQAWIAIAIDRWDDALVNLPWLAAYVALTAGLFGQLRRLGLEPSFAILATYCAVAVPFVNVHVALAGYADLHVAAVLALAVVALAEWDEKRAKSALVLLAFTAPLLPTLKVPGIAWLGTVALGFVVATFATSRIRLAGGALAVLAATVSVAIVLGPTRLAVAPGADQQQEIAQSLVQHLFAFGSWNLLWYAVPLAVAVAWQQALALRGTLTTLAAGLAFLAWTFFLTKAGDWVVDYTTVNRALLHIAPAAVAFAALVLHRRALEPAARAPEQQPA